MYPGGMIVSTVITASPIRVFGVERKISVVVCTSIRGMNAITEYEYVMTSTCIYRMSQFSVVYCLFKLALVMLCVLFTNCLNRFVSIYTSQISQHWERDSVP